MHSLRVGFRNFGRFHSLRSLLVFWLASIPLCAETLTLLNSQAGSTPLKLGYNLGHFMPDSNAADWFRHSGVDAARVFMSAAAIEPTDDLPPVGDGVASESAFFNRRALLRANASSTTAALNNSYVNWPVFTGNYSDTTTSGNRLRLDHAFATLRDMGVESLANITASSSRFPITGENDWPGKWELWQHYYAQAFLLSRDFGVKRFGMFNEPNGVDGFLEADWLVRLRICSDAIQCAIEDMNARHGKSLVPQVFAPNTANGAEKYNTLGADDATTDTWGRDAVVNRHLRLDGTSPEAWMNLHVYNYQKYTSRQISADGFSGFVTDYDALRGLIDADMPGEPSLPMALTEFNVRTGANYDVTTSTQDSPFDYAALGANCIALSERGINQLYLFKFGQTSSDSFYGIAKNGTHYVQNASGTARNYGGATQCAEVYRLFVKAAKGARPRLNLAATAGASPGVNTGLWSMATHDPATGTYHVFISNRNAGSIPLEVDFSALPVPMNNPVFVEEVSNQAAGGVVRMDSLANGRLASADMPGQSVWLITLPGQAMAVATRSAVADTQLGDGSSKQLPGGGIAAMEVRADGTVDGRRACLMRIPIPGGNPANTHSVLLEFEAAATSGTEPVRAHVYGVTDNSWTETNTTWLGAAGVLKQDVPAGNLILNNIVEGQGAGTLILGQVVVNSSSAAKCSLDVTGFVRSRGDGFASFLVVQDHRWDVAQPDLTVGDTQLAGLRITSREGVSPPRLVALTSDLAPVIETQPQGASVFKGAPITINVSASGTGPLTYQWRKNGNDLPAEVSSSLLISSAAASDAGDYQVVVGNPLGTVISNVAALEVIAAGSVTVAREATIRGGSSAGSDVDENAAAYLMVKFNAGLDTARKSYFQFDLPPATVYLDEAATFRLEFQASFAQQVQLWGLKQGFPDFNTAVTWNNAPANDLASNGMLLSGISSAAAIGPSVRINPGSALNSYSFTVPRIGDFVFADKVTLVLSGVDEASNNSGGLRIALASAKLDYAVNVDPPWTKWRKLEFGPDFENDGISGAMADPDHDGIANLLEYALGGDPMMAGTGILPVIHTGVNPMEFVFTRNPQHVDLRMTVEVADDVGGTWSDAAVSTGGAAFVPLMPSVTVSEDSGETERTVTIIHGTPSLPQHFMRLRAEWLAP